MAGVPFYDKTAAQNDAVYKDWLRKNKLNESDDYDMYAAFKAGLRPDARGHMDDTFKKPNHITFSTDSRFSRPGQEGGRWMETPGGSWAYQASPFVVRQHPPEELQRYFQQNEPDATLILPDGRVFAPKKKDK